MKQFEQLKKLVFFLPGIEKYLHNIMRERTVARRSQEKLGGARIGYGSKNSQGEPKEP